MDSLVRILKPKGVITAQVGSQDKKPLQVENWLNVFNHHFGNTNLSRVYIPSFVILAHSDILRPHTQAISPSTVRTL